jgi:hypothetical protein
MRVDFVQSKTEDCANRVWILTGFHYRSVICADRFGGLSKGST